MHKCCHLSRGSYNLAQMLSFFIHYDYYFGTNYLLSLHEKFSSPYAKRFLLTSFSYLLYKLTFSNRSEGISLTSPCSFRKCLSAAFLHCFAVLFWMTFIPQNTVYSKAKHLSLSTNKVSIAMSVHGSGLDSLSST